MTFHFKSFSITQKQSAMKVGTDGVLLGAWANPTSYPHKILDIGTGTGLIAIMLAQRFSESLVQAIEIDELSAKEAQFNAKSSPFSNRIDVKHCSRTVDISRILSTNRYSFFFLLLLLFSLAHSPLDHIGAQALLAGTAPHY